MGTGQVFPGVAQFQLGDPHIPAGQPFYSDGGLTCLWTILKENVLRMTWLELTEKETSMVILGPENQGLRKKRPSMERCLGGRHLKCRHQANSPDLGSEPPG